MPILRPWRPAQNGPSMPAAMTTSATTWQGATSAPP